MTEVLRIPAGTKMAVDSDGKFFAVDDDDPRATFFVPRDVEWINGGPAPMELVYIHPDSSLVDDFIRDTFGFF